MLSARFFANETVSMADRVNLKAVLRMRVPRAASGAISLTAALRTSRTVGFVIGKRVEHSALSENHRRVLMAVVLEMEAVSRIGSMAVAEAVMPVAVVMIGRRS